MRNLKRGLLIGALFIIGALVLSGCQGGGGPQAQPTPPAAAKASNKIVAEGSVVPVQQARLGFSTMGTVTELPIKIGDKVAAGQSLAKLDTTDQESAVRKADAAVKTAEANLAKAKAGPRAEDVAAAEAKVGVAEAGVQAAEGRLTATRGRAGDASATVGSTQARAGDANAGITSAQARVAAAQAQLDSVRAGATAEALGIAAHAIEQARNQLLGLQGQRDALCGQSLPKALRDQQQGQCDAMRGQVQAAEEAVNIAQLNYQSLQNGATPETIAAAEAALNQAQGDLAGAQARARAAQSDISGAQARAGASQGDIQASEGDVANAQASLAAAQSELARAKVPARPEDIAVAEAQLNEAKTALANAKVELDRATLKAPFAGTIAALDMKLGERVSPNTPLITLADLSQYQIETTDLTELNVVKLKTGDPAAISFDALPGVEIPGKIIRIDDLGQNKQGDIVYTVVVRPDQQDERMRWKMTASVAFEPPR
ncbi:MAG: efflux RND transporter periplasmic adaptor subunit [Anaerolineae bacterium]|nr:efflux RND transporter periplasmic adaptor subunit [Anaerolineae bacterium]